MLTFEFWNFGTSATVTKYKEIKLIEMIKRVTQDDNKCEKNIKKASAKNEVNVFLDLYIYPFYVCVCGHGCLLAYLYVCIV